MSGGESHSAVSNSKCLLRVKTGKARYEHMISALPPKADSGRTSRDVRFVPQPDITEWRPAPRCGIQRSKF